MRTKLLVPGEPRMLRSADEAPPSKREMAAAKSAALRWVNGIRRKHGRPKLATLPRGRRSVYACPIGRALGAYVQPYDRFGMPWDIDVIPRSKKYEEEFWLPEDRRVSDFAVWFDEGYYPELKSRKRAKELGSVW